MFLHFLNDAVDRRVGYKRTRQTGMSMDRLVSGEEEDAAPL